MRDPIPDAEKVRIYEDLLHTIQMHAEVTMDRYKVSVLIDRICKWSYAHRSGNGERTEEEQDALIEKHLLNLNEPIIAEGSNGRRSGTQV